MKRISRIILMLAGICLGAASAFAQQSQNLPNDPAVRTGKLDNGMTYYIRHNENPENRAEFYLATHIGAIQETPDQDGLAHFLEHMCFNGTKNFPGKGILNYLQGIGASFGGNVNASTGVEQTVYMLNNIPLVDDSVIDSCILIMHDYSHFVTLAHEEIDSERGVILEEKRSRNGASWRMHEKAAPYYYGDSKYATCTIIGSEENLKNFKYSSIENFYKTWCRPDNQALIVVGDIDVDSVEGKIKSIFSDIPAPVNPKAKDVVTVPDNAEPLVGVITDPENTSSRIEVLWRSQPMPKELNGTAIKMVNDILETIVTQVMSERFGDLAAVSNPPFLSAGLYFGDLTESCYTAMGQISIREGGAIPALKSFITEVKKMGLYGFTDAEIERAKSDILARYENAANSASTRQNSEYINELISNFFDGTPYMEPKAEYEMAQQIMQMLAPDAINQAVAQAIEDKNVSIIYYGTEKEGLEHPTADQLLGTYKEAMAAEIAKNADEETELVIMDASKLKGGKIKSEKAGPFGSTIIELKNGVKAILYPSELEKDKIIISMSRDGGESLVATEDLPSIDGNVFSAWSGYAGLGNLSNRELSKALSGKAVSMSPQIGTIRNGVSGSSSVKDFETALQLLYQHYINPRFDEEEYGQAITRLQAVLPNLVNSPNYKLQTHLISLLYPGNDRQSIISEETLEKANLATLQKIYTNLFSGVDGATVRIVGDFKVEDIKPLVVKYIGSLPKGKKTNYVDQHLDVEKGTRTDDFAVQMQTPMVTIYRNYTSFAPFSYKQEAALDAAVYILRMRYTNSLREEAGGTYSPGVFSENRRQPSAMAQFQVYFETNTEQADLLREIADRDLKKFAEEGPTAEEMDMTKKNMLKNIPESRKSLSYWSGVLNTWNKFGEDSDAEYEAAVNDLTGDDVKALVKTLLDEGNVTELIMRPE